MSLLSYLKLSPDSHDSSSPEKRGFSLKAKLTGVMLLTVSAIAAIVHVPWVYTSQQNVNDMVSQLNKELMRGTRNEVSNLFQNVLAAKQLIKSSLDEGLITLDEPTSQSLFYLNLLQTHKNFTWVQFGFANGDYLGAQRKATDEEDYSIIKRQWDATLGDLGQPGTDLAAKQAQRALLANVYRQTEEWPATVEQARRTVETYQFTENKKWTKIYKKPEEKEIYYAPIRPFYEAAIARPGEDVWTDVYVFRTGNAVGLDASITYREAEDSPILGVISISFELQQISDYLANLKEESAEGAVFILNKEGYFIASSNPESLEETFTGEGGANLMQMEDDIKDPYLKIASQSLTAQGTAIAAINKPQEFSYYDPSTRRRYHIAFEPLGQNTELLNQLNWVVGTVTPEVIFLEHINRNKRRLLIAIVSFLGVGALAAVVLSDRAIAQPILTISAAAEAIEDGNFSTDSLDQAAHRNDELGRLARVFQDMAREICTREYNLRQQLQALKIEVNEVRRTREVREIVETDFFQNLQTKARSLRKRSQLPSAVDGQNNPCSGDVINRD